MNMTSLEEEKKTIDFVKKAAKVFKDNIIIQSFTEGEITKDCLFALKSGLANDCIVVFKLDKDYTPTCYQQIIKK